MISVTDPTGLPCSPVPPDLTSNVDWSKCGGLLPVIVQDESSRIVLMLGYMNEEALRLSSSSGFVTFFSRTRQKIWRKGETSGNVLKLRSMELDCDQDTLLIEVETKGPTCHLGSNSCFGDQVAPSFITELDKLIADRQANPRPKSYTSKLLGAGRSRLGQKVGEEGVEVALAAQYDDDQELLSEAADLTYHLLVLLRSRGLSWADLDHTLTIRHRN